MSRNSAFSEEQKFPYCCNSCNSSENSEGPPSVIFFSNLHGR